MSKSLFRRELSSFKAYVSGKPIEQVRRELGLERIEKLASNENQFGPSPKAVEAIINEAKNINFYPEANAHDLVLDIADYLSVSPEQVVVGNGGEGIIWNISMTFLNAGDEIIVADPTFDIYKISGDILGAVTVKVPLKDMKYDLDAMLEAVNEKTKLIYICTPNNPTGTIVEREELLAFIEKLPKDVVLILDEAYYDFATVSPEYPADSISIIDKRENTIVLRTFSKIYGIAGVRIGYIITSKTLAKEISKVRQTLGVNRLAQVAARAALSDEQYKEFSRFENKKARDVLLEYFDKRGLPYFPTYANFVWVNIKRDSKTVFEELQKKGIVIRPGFLWGWDKWMRINTGTPEQMELFKEKMDEIIAEIKEA